MDNKINDIALITLTSIWACIDWDKIDKRRAMGLWDEYANKIKAVANTTNNYELFIEKLARKMCIESFKYRELADISLNTDEEIKKKVIKTFRENTRLLVLQLRMNRELVKETKAKTKEGSNV